MLWGEIILKRGENKMGNTPKGRSVFQQSILLQEEDKQQYFWTRDDLDNATVVSPLFASFMIPALRDGASKALAEMNAPLPGMNLKLYHGYLYSGTASAGVEGAGTENVGAGNTGSEGVSSEGVSSEGAGAETDLKQKHQAYCEWVRPLYPELKKRLYDVVENDLLPFYDQLNTARRRELSLSEAAEQVQELFDFYQKAWGLHFEVALPLFQLLLDLDELFQQCTQNDDRAVLFELLTGTMNQSLAEDRELWLLSERVRQNRVLLHMFTEEPVEELLPKLAATLAGREFLVQLQAFLEQYGYKSANSHTFTDETWLENPVYALSAIADYVRNGGSFEETFRRTVDNRKEQYARILAEIQEGEQKQQFIQHYEWALEAACIEDDHHFYIDAMLPGTARLFLVHVADLLVSHHVIDDREDIFYLYYDELQEVLSQPQPLSDLVQERKEELQRFTEQDVPEHFGERPHGRPPIMQNPIVELKFGMLEPSVTTEEEVKTFQGYAACKGVHTGTVKLVRGQHEFHKVQQGDVLVCQATTPPWTVLFSKAGAIITDTGGILSHAGIVAREYLVPAVLGTKVATSLLKDGDMVTVDGTNGKVKVHEQA
jgi:rifampicin phosphotransferase